LMTAVRRLSQLIRERQERLNERREHDFAMQDPGVANEHALSIARALDRGEPGCSICS
jgi:hypothetical protein